MPMTDKPVDASRGTAIWGINRLRSDLLPALLADLAKLSTEGIERGQCMRVAKTLAQLRSIRQKLSERIRRHLGTIEREADIRAVEAAFASFRDLAAEFPDALPQVGSAVDRFYAGLIARSEPRRPR